MNARTIPLLATLAVFVLLYAIGAVRYHDRNFFTVQVFIDFLVDNSFLGIVAIGMTLVIITGGIDLSVGGLVALCTVVMAKLMTPAYMDPLTRFLIHCHILNAANACVTMYYVAPILSWLVAIAVGLTMGFLTGCAVRYFKIEPFIATLAGLFLARGLALVLSTESIDIDSGVVRGLNDVGFHLGRVQHFVPLAAGLGIVAIGLVMLFVAPVGRRLLAMGGAKPMLLGAILYAALFAIVLYILSQSGVQNGE